MSLDAAVREIELGVRLPGEKDIARAKEISIMRLVGATDGFIRRPFLVEGSIKGVLGGILALALTYFAMRVRYATENARAALAGTGVSVPRLREYFDRLMDYAVAVDWGRAPSDVRRNARLIRAA